MDYRKLFINYLRTEKSLSENTIESYTFDLERFTEFIGSRSIDLGDVDQPVIQDFIKHLKKGDEENKPFS
ncbi:MAG TPA: site-specific integrase, partial [Ignavibacteria bacterium]|nr:site-specific integrase [Ignavibacteria bacterium]